MLYTKKYTEYRQIEINNSISFYDITFTVAFLNAPIDDIVEFNDLKTMFNEVIKPNELVKSEHPDSTINHVARYLLYEMVDCLKKVTPSRDWTVRMQYATVALNKGEEYTEVRINR